jgi:Coenzyme PQQ synthesis protein D (PqqD)
MSTVRYLRHPDLRLTALEGEGVVLHLKARKYFSVNETGLLILEALKQPQTFDELVNAVLREYEVTPETAAETARAFLDHCLSAAVIEQVE